MKIIFKQHGEILRHIDVNKEVDAATQKEIQEKFDNKMILKYEIEFTENTLVGEVHNLANIDVTKIDSIAIILR